MRANMIQDMILSYILFGLATGCAFAELQGCKKAGIYPGTTNREFIVCTAGGAEGTQFVQTKHTCPINTVYKDHRCVPTLIVPYLATMGSADAQAAVVDDKKSDNKEKSDDVILTCKTYGLLCTSCKQLSICIGDEDSKGVTTYHEIKMMKCTDDQVCTPGQGCTPTNATTFCPYRKFECSDVGTYPDPYDCTVYYRCEPTAKGFNTIKMSCSEGSFNSATSSCGYDMSRTACITTPVPLCQTIFQMGPVPDNLSIYYICIPNDADHTLAPSMHRCPANLQFDIKTLTCT